MRVETSVSLPEELLAAIDRCSLEADRSAFVEKALRAYLAGLEARREQKDLDLINEHAVELNREAEDVLAFQVRF